MKILHKTRKGVALLIGIGLITVIMFFSLLISNVVVSGTRDSANFKWYNSAYYAAESGLEIALLDAANHGIGYTTQNSLTLPPNCTGTNDPTCLKMNYKIQSQVPDDRKYDNGTNYDDQFGIPTPGTGNVGNDCDPIDAFFEGYFYYSAVKEPHYISEPQTDYDGPFKADLHPCNWNKIGFGETVNIPLYKVMSDDSSNCLQDTQNPAEYICNPKQLEMSSIVVRFRTPCGKGNEMCIFSDRPFLNYTEPTDNDFLGDDPIVAWSVGGVDLNSGSLVSLEPILEKDFDFYFFKLWKEPFTATASIYESKINYYKNTAKNYEVIPTSLKAFDLSENKGSIINFLKDLYPWTAQQISRPVLKFSVIGKLEDTIGAKVPYLEYQVITTSSLAPTDAASTITGEALGGTFKSTLEVSLPSSTGIPEYVVQQ